MKKTILILSASIAIASCNSSATYQCTCTDQDGKEVATYELKQTSKESAAFECKQKNISFANNDALKGVGCTID